VFLFSHCEEEQKPEPVKKVFVRPHQDVNKILSKEIESALRKTISDYQLCNRRLETPQVLTLFHSGIPNYLWSDNGKCNAMSDSLMYLIQNARWYGLVSHDYFYKELDSLRGIFYNKKDSVYDVYAIAQFELLSTYAYIKMGVHLNKGRFYPDSLLLRWSYNHSDTLIMKEIRKGIYDKDLRKSLDSLEPKHLGYKMLRTEFRKFLCDTAIKDFDSVPFYSVTDTSEFLALLKQRLLINKDYDSTAKGNDSVKMAKALKKFQKRMNLDPDGKLGKFTRHALSYSKEKMIRQMEMAMERWRWEPADFPKIYFWVNIPAADLHIYEEDKDEIDTLVLYSKVVVGKAETPTPILKAKINFMQIYPYWNVPFSIAWKEILPIVQRDTSYLRKHNLEVIDGKGRVVSPGKLRWKKFTKDYLPVKFRQRIGGDNSLGVVKFNFYNPYGVYLHDTNSKRYFKTFYRFQSHGCIRLERYIETANFLIRDDSLKYKPDSLLKYFAEPIQRKINIKKPVPIFIRYYTCEADSLGLHFNLDIYRKDEKMMEMLYR
jgi:murein L,D-transpeptidase YcbB/YkuD